jgi:hypothetical protein
VHERLRLRIAVAEERLELGQHGSNGDRRQSLLPGHQAMPQEAGRRRIGRGHGQAGVEQAGEQRDGQSFDRLRWTIGDRTGQQVARLGDAAGRRQRTGKGKQRLGGQASIAVRRDLEAASRLSGVAAQRAAHRHLDEGVLGLAHRQAAVGDLGQERRHHAATRVEPDGEDPGIVARCHLELARERLVRLAQQLARPALLVLAQPIDAAAELDRRPSREQNAGQHETGEQRPQEPEPGRPQPRHRATILLAARPAAWPSGVNRLSNTADPAEG